MSGISLTAPQALNGSFNYALANQGTDGTYDYYSFEFANIYTVNWNAGVAYPVAKLQIFGGCLGTGNFEIINNAWTTANNGDFYQELNGQAVQNIIWQPTTTVPLGNLCNLTVAGKVATEAANGVDDATVGIAGGGNGVPAFSFTDLSDNTGQYAFPNAIPKFSNLSITPVKDDNPLNGVTTLDLVLISKHILGLQTLNSPYKMIAADANKNNSITTTDVVEFRKLILGIYQKLPNNTSWRFVDAAYVFPNPANAFQGGPFPENITIANLQTEHLNENFTGVKVGDVNGSVIANAGMPGAERSAGTLLFDVSPPQPPREGGAVEAWGDYTVRAGETFTVHFSPAEKVLGYQFTMNLKGLKVVEIMPGAGMDMENFGLPAEAQNAQEGALTTSYNGDQTGAFSVTFQAMKSGQLSDLLGVSSRITKAEAYSEATEKLDVAFRFNQHGVPTISGIGFELYQNQPNPFSGKTAIGFHLGEPAAAKLTIYDDSGRVLITQQGDFAKGHNTFTIDSLTSVPGSTILYYKVETANHVAARKMIQMK